MSLQLAHYPRKMVLISPLPLFFWVFFCATERGCLGDARLEWHGEGWTAHCDRIVGRILSWEHLASFAYFARLLCTSPWKGTVSVSSAAESYQRLANPRADESVQRVRPPHFMSLLAAGKKEDTRCQTALLWLNTFAKGAMTTQEGRRKSDTQMKFWLFWNY